VKRGRTKIITVTPEGAYRDDITRHTEAVDRYRAEIVPLRRPLNRLPPRPWQIQTALRPHKRAGHLLQRDVEGAAGLNRVSAYDLCGVHCPKLPAFFRASPRP
jgi:hypothetical protein